ncbi:nickel ABC transporter substrate-binding protein [Pseudalkalibacillus sp. Hm43]|uniref:nickel ABC transporter substrate-binding protein n=1 Tax=Pseudalkalibacillus sp. Hm43 TaxID=3450742 RepID=UPI003F439FDD
MKIKHLFTLLVLMLVVTACSSGQTNGTSGEKELTFLFNFTASTLDPHIDQNSTAVRAGITETLVKLNEDLELEPWLASEWENTDPTTWTFTIKEGITFQDGTEMDAHAVKESFQRAIDVSESVKAALKIDTISVEGNQVIFKTTEPLAAFPSELTHPHTSIVKMDEDETLSKQPVGTGPFKVEQFQSEVNVELSKYTAYWDGEPKLDKVNFGFNTDANARAMALRSGEADIVYYLPSDIASSLKEEKNLKVESNSSLRTHFIAYNLKSQQVDDLKVRKAIDALIDREAVAKDIMGKLAVPAGGPFNPEFPFSLGEKPASLDVHKAKTLLEEAGYTEKDGRMSKAGQPLVLNMITYQSRPELPLIAQMIQSNAEQLGVKMNIKTVDNIDEYLSTNEDWDIATYSNLTAPRGDAGYFLNVAYLPDGALNVGEIDDPAINEKVSELNQMTEPEKRNALAKDIEGITNEKVYQSFIVHPTLTVAMNDRVKHFHPGEQEHYLITHTLDVE